MRKTSRYVWVNGELLDQERAHLPFLTAALHHGIAVFEGVRGYATPHGPAVFRLREHVDRLIDSARALGFRDLPVTGTELTRAIKDTVRASGFADCYIRPVIYLAAGAWSPSLDTGRAQAGIAVWQAEPVSSPNGPEDGVRVHVSSFTRHAPGPALTKARLAGGHVNTVLARTESRRLGFDEAILLDGHGCVAECTSESVFLVRQGTLCVPPATTEADVVTRDTILTMARSRRIVVVDAPISRDQLHVADEVFFGGTGAEVLPVCEIDGRRVGTGRAGPVTRELQDALGALTRGAHPLSTAWLTLVDPEPRPEVAPILGLHERPEVIEMGYGHGV